MEKMNNFLGVAIKAAKEAGDLILNFYHNDMDIQNKGDGWNLVTNADLEAERLIVSRIKKKFPSHSFLAEEEHSKDNSLGYLWIIDPIDGTTNYSRGIPLFCVSIALYKKNEPILSVIYDPIRKELFHALKSSGAFLNDKKISVSNISKLEDSIISTGFCDRGELMIETINKVRSLFLKKIKGFRRSGSISIDLCYVACGRIDSHFELKPSPSAWDYAPGALIIEEAGGIVSEINGGKFSLNTSSILASNGKLHKLILDTFNGKRKD